jgi:heptosyltransferase-2
MSSPHKPHLPDLLTTALPLRPPVVVFQPLPGIGDMIWHLPHLRAIAAHAGTPVTLVTKPRSMADQLLQNESSIADIIWLDRNPSGRQGEHDGLRGFLGLVRTLRQRRFNSAILMHKSVSMAAAVLLAGIPNRQGYGWDAQQLFLNTGPYLSPAIAKLRPHARATAFLREAGIPLASAEPSLSISSATRAAARQKLQIPSAAFVAIGIGSSENLRRWSNERFALLAEALLDAGWPAIVLIGGPGDMPAAAAIQSALGDKAERVRVAAFYTGNDTGVMNMAAAAGVRAYVLFGRTPPIKHASQVISVVTPDIGVHDGVHRVTPAMVLDAIFDDRGTLSP